uniref:Uncharacterized protein n=1 Tax=Fagus sylvatica TaxID=28930 RepID=A0A2N9GZR8_FAGSY
MPPCVRRFASSSAACLARGCCSGRSAAPPVLLQFFTSLCQSSGLVADRGGGPVVSPYQGDLGWDFSGL